MRLTEAEDPRVSREIAEQLLKTGGGLLLFICAANGLALAMPRLRCCGSRRLWGWGTWASLPRRATGQKHSAQAFSPC